MVQCLYIINYVDPEQKKQWVFLLFHEIGLCLMDPGPIKMDPNLLRLLKHVKLCLQINIVMEPNTLQGHDTAPIYPIIKASISQFYTFRDP